MSGQGTIFTMKIDEERLKKFKLLCQFNGESMAAAVKRLIDERLEKNATKIEMIEEFYAKMNTLDKADEKNEEGKEDGSGN